MQVQSEMARVGQTDFISVSVHHIATHVNVLDFHLTT
jgi:hypothetical protein